jgi:hypothetical protein
LNKNDDHLIGGLNFIILGYHTLTKSKLLELNKDLLIESMKKDVINEKKLKRGESNYKKVSLTSIIKNEENLFFIESTIPGSGKNEDFYNPFMAINSEDSTIYFVGCNCLDQKFHRSPNDMKEKINELKKLELYYCYHCCSLVYNLYHYIKKNSKIEQINKKVITRSKNLMDTNKLNNVKIEDFQGLSNFGNTCYMNSVFNF